MQIFSELKEISPSTSGNPETKKVSFATVYFLIELKTKKKRKKKRKCSLLFFFEHRKGVLPQIYLGDFAQSPTFAERIT